MKKQIFAITIASLIFLSAIVFSLSYVFAPSVDSSSIESLKLVPNVCLTINGVESECSHNIVTNVGLDAIESAIGAGTTSSFLNITLGNSSAVCGTPDATSSESFTAFSANGLGSGTGTYTSNGVGNWSVYKQFTSSGSTNLIVGCARLQNVTGATFAAIKFANNITLDGTSSDTIAVNWTTAVVNAA